MRFPIKFAGVDGVRIVELDGRFIVQSQWQKDRTGHWSPTKVRWYEVGAYDTVDEALDAAPDLCEF